MAMNVFGKHYGLVVIVVMCSLASFFTYTNSHKSEPLKPTVPNGTTTISAPKVEPEAEGESITPASTSPLDANDPFEHKQTEEEVMASIVRNACLQRCPSGTVPVFVGDEIVGYFNHESASMINFNLGERLNL